MFVLFQRFLSYSMEVFDVWIFYSISCEYWSECRAVCKIYFIFHGSVRCLNFSEFRHNEIESKLRRQVIIVMLDYAEALSFKIHNENSAIMYSWWNIFRIILPSWLLHLFRQNIFNNWIRLKIKLKGDGILSLYSIITEWRSNFQNFSESAFTDANVWLGMRRNKKKMKTFMNCSRK